MSSDPGNGMPHSRMIRMQLPSSPLAPRQARATIRRALSAWHLDTLATDSELLISELVANASEHGNGSAIDLTIRHQLGPGESRGILCQVTDTAPAMPQVGPLDPASERGRGLHIVAALATDSGVTTNARGKTAWFTLATAPDLDREAQADFEAEASA